MVIILVIMKLFVAIVRELLNVFVKQFWLGSTLEENDEECF